MLTTIAGTFRDGRVELSETPKGIAEAKVLVTFLPNGAAPQLSREQLADLRHRFQAFAEDWERPEMDIYDQP